MSAPRCAPGMPAWRPRPPAVRRRQGGFSLIGMALALALTTAVAIWASNEVVQRIEASAARSTK